MRRTIFVAAVTLLLVMLPEVAYACPVCFGAQGDPMNKAANNGIFFLLGVIGLVQLGFVALFWSFWRRAKDIRRTTKEWHVIQGGIH